MIEESMSDREVFAALRARGASSAVVEFSGGNDQGGADAITLYASAPPEAEDTEVSLGEISESYAYGAAREKVTEQEKADDALAGGLSTPVYAEYGSFAGEFYVNGRVTWTVDGEKVLVSKEERNEYSEHSEYEV